MNNDKWYLDYNNVDKIIKDYLLVNEFSGLEIKSLKKDIKKVCDKYGDRKDIDYILESDYIFGRANDYYEYNTQSPLGIKYDNIELIDNINGIVVYKSFLESGD